MSNYNFPKDFLFGVATSAEQSEGKKNFPFARTNWDLLFKKDKNLFFNQVGPDLTNDVLEHHTQDLVMLKEVGINSYRTSFSWAKLFPSPNLINKKALDFYHSYLDEMIKNNFKVFMCLNHFDLPTWVVRMGGFENKKVAKHFLEYAKFVIKEFGNKIDYLATFNEPVVPIQAGYLGKYHYPQIVDNKKAVQAAYGTILSHSLVVNYFNENWRGKIKTKIGVIVNIAPVLPKDNIDFTQEDKLAADKYNLLHNYAFLDAMAKGEFSSELIDILKQENIMPNYTQQEIDLIAQNYLDFIGTNFYNPFRIQAPLTKKSGNDVSIFDQCGDVYQWDQAVMNKSRGWEILPEMILFIADIIKNRYNNIPFYISENGMGVEGEERFRNKETNIIEDKYRCAFINQHLHYVLKAIYENQVNCFGYHLWTGIDCWSWMNAYKNRYGFIELDLNDQSRRLKYSGYWFKKNIIDTNTIDENFLSIDDYKI